MNSVPPTLEQQLDRLVDGELSREEYRVLLAALEVEPHGWRKCALAFLEAQSLRGELQALRRECLEPAPPTTAALQPAARPASHAAPAGTAHPRTDHKRLGFLALAACILVALSLGHIGTRWLNRDNSRGGTTVAADEQDTSQPRTAADVAPSLAGVGNVPSRHVAAKQPLGNLTFIGNDGQEQASVPYYNAQDGAEYLLNPGAAVPEEVLQQWVRRGQRVEMEPGVLPYQLEDGTHVLLPVERYRIHRASQRPVQ